MKNKRISFFAVVLLIIFLVSGCLTARGPAYEGHNEIPKGKALIYLYKANAWGKDIYRVKINGQIITTLKKGGYYPYYANEGNVEISANNLPRINIPLLIDLVVKSLLPEVTMTLDVVEGQVYYVRASTGFANVKLEQVSEVVGRTQIKECMLLPSHVP